MSVPGSLTSSTSGAVNVSGATLGPLRGDWFVYSSPCLESLARQFGDVRPIQRRVFDDGCPNLKISGVPDIMAKRGGANVLFFHAYRSLEQKKMEEMLVFVLAETGNVERLVVVDPFDAWATMERVTQEGEVASANIDAHFWKTLPLTQSGRKVLRLIYDQHTLQNRFFFQGGNTHVAYRSGVPLVMQHFARIGWLPDATRAIAFPDDGAAKRFGKMFVGYHIIVCGKKRGEGDERVVTILDGDCKGRSVCIMDDLVRSGGTLIECAKGLLDHGAREVNCYVTHAEFPKDSWKKFLPETCPVKFANFWVTDTCADVTQKLEGVEPFRVISIGPDVKQFIEALIPNSLL